MRRFAALALVGALALAGCGGGPKKVTPKDDPKTKESIEKPPEIELPSFDDPAPAKGDAKPEEKK